jgi:Spy/CpxP family protein refolding chaperone
LEQEVTNHMNKKIAALTLTAALGLAGTAAIAAPGGHGAPTFFPLMRALRHLELTDAQEDAVYRMGKELRNEGRAARNNAMASMGEAANELEKAKPDGAKLHRIADERVAEMNKLVHSAIDKFLGVHATLTPEQRATLAKDLRRVDKKGRDRGDD